MQFPHRNLFTLWAAGGFHGMAGSLIPDPADLPDIKFITAFAFKIPQFGFCFHLCEFLFGREEFGEFVDCTHGGKDR